MEIVPLFDIPHVFKCMRNNMLDKDIRFDKDKFATWDHVKTAFEIDTFSGNNNRCLPKLTPKHVYAHKIDKMNVKLCANVFSGSVAKKINEWAGGPPKSTDEGPKTIPADGANTAFVLGFFNKLFDALNGKVEKDKNSQFRTLLTDESFHLKFFDEAIATLSGMKFVSTTTRDVVDQPPSLNNLIKTIQGIKVLWKNLKQLGFISLKTRNLNQDPLENFFSQVRGLSANRKPDCFQFIGIFKTLLFNTFSNYKSSHSNCENDESFVINSLKTITFNTVKTVRDDVYVQRKIVRNVCKQDAIPEKGHISRNIGTFMKNFMKKNHLLMTCETCCNIVSKAVNSSSFRYVFNDTESILRNIIPNIYATTGISRKASNIWRKEIRIEHISCFSHRDQMMDQFLSLCNIYYLQSITAYLDAILRGSMSIDLEKYPRSNVFVVKAKSKYASSIKSKYHTYATISKK